MQVRALAKCRIAIDCFDEPLGNGFGIQAEEPGQLTHAFAVCQADDDGASVRRHPYK